MKFSIFHIAMGKGRTSDRAVYDDLISDLRLADRLPFDVFWLAEHHFNSDFSMSPSPNVLLGAAAVLTERIKIGAAINVLPFHNPVRMAEECAQLDLLSNGRFQWGIGRGITGHEFEGYGIDPSTSAERFREMHDLVLHAFATGDMQWDGQYYKVPKGICLAPPPVQRPHPPVWMAAQSPHSVAFAAQHGYPAMQVAETIERGRKHVQAYRAAAKEAGRTPDERGMIVPCRYIFVAETQQEAIEIGGRHITEWWAEFTAVAGPRGAAQLTKGYEYYQEKRSDFWVQQEGIDFEQLNESGVIAVGTPKQVIELLERQISALDLRHIMCDFWRAGKSREQRQKSMQLFAQKVIPYFS